MRGSCMACVPASCVASLVSTRRMADMGEASPSGGKRKKPGRTGAGETCRVVRNSLSIVYFLSCTSTCGKTTCVQFLNSFLGEQSFECVELQRPACSLCRDTVTTDGFFDVTHPSSATPVSKHEQECGGFTT